MTELLTIPEVAERLRVSRRMVEKLLSTGQLRKVGIGTRTLITDREVEAYIAHQESLGRQRRA